MGTTQVRISDNLYEEAQLAGLIRTRSANQQIEHWAKLGKIGESNPNLTIDEIQNILISLEQGKQGKISDYVFGEGEDK